MKSSVEICEQLKITPPYPSTYIGKTIFLRNFIDAHSDLPEQGSEEWLKVRTKTIGGSEISTVFGCGMGSLKQMAMDKAGISTFNGNFNTRWGTMFEPVVQMYLERLFSCNIDETGSLPGCVAGTSYSPDGFAVIKSEHIKLAIKSGLIEDHQIPEDPLVLFEIKSPAVRHNSSRQIPDYYLNQPRSGLMHFPFLDIAYYVEVVFRITTKSNIDSYNSGERPLVYNEDIHRRGHKYTEMMEYGYIVYTEDYNEPKDYYDMNALLQDPNVRYGLGEYDAHPGDGLVVWFAVCDILIKPLYRDPEVFNEINLHLISRFLDNMDKIMVEHDREKKIKEIWG
jgi:hypothetical protein